MALYGRGDCLKNKKVCPVLPHSICGAIIVFPIEIAINARGSHTTCSDRSYRSIHNKIIITLYYYRRKCRSQTSDNMDRWKAEMGRVREEKRREEKKKDDQEEKVSEERRSRKHCVFPMICGSGGSKSRLAKAAGAEPAGQMRDEKLHAEMYKTPQPRSNFGSWDVEKVHAVVERSTFRSQKCKKLTGSEHFWKLRCRKSARRCGAKHISKSKV